MQTFRIRYIGIIFQQIIDFPFGIFWLSEFGGYVDLPMREFFVERLDPFGDTRLARIDFLSAADETDNRRPIFSLIERPNQKCRFRQRKVRNLKLISVCSPSLQIIGKPFVRPRTLRLIENRHVLDLAKTRLFHSDRLARIDFQYTVFDGILNLRQHIIAVAVYHLNGFAHFATRVCQLLRLTLLSTFFVIVLRERLIQYRNQRTITGKINGALILHGFLIPLICLFDRNFQADQRLARSRHTRHKTNALFPFALAVLHHLQNIGNRLIGRNLVRLVPRDIFHRVIFV